MAPPINPYQVMGKKSKEASLSKGKGKARESTQAKKSRRPIFEVIASEQATPSADSGSTVPDHQTQLPQIVELDKPEEKEDPAPRKKKKKGKD
jgi:hypothetical protein